MFLCDECGKNLKESNFYLKKVKNKCNDCLKKLKCQVFSKIFTNKLLTSHIEREHQSFESKPNVLEKSAKNHNNTTIKTEICALPQQPKIDNNNKKSKQTYCFSIRKPLLSCYRSKKRSQNLLHVENT